MKILFYGDSITDAGRDRETELRLDDYGSGYVKYVVESLLANGYTFEDLVNRGISGNRVVDLYARIKVDCWNHNPDLISILIGVNDVWHEIEGKNGVELDRFEKVYRMLIEDTKAKLPNVKILIMEPFILKGAATACDEAKWPKIHGCICLRGGSQKACGRIWALLFAFTRQAYGGGKRGGNRPA